MSLRRYHLYFSVGMVQGTNPFKTGKAVAAAVLLTGKSAGRRASAALAARASPRWPHCSHGTAREHAASNWVEGVAEAAVERGHGHVSCHCRVPQSLPRTLEAAAREQRELWRSAASDESRSAAAAGGGERHPARCRTAWRTSWATRATRRGSDLRPFQPHPDQTRAHTHAQL